MADYEENVNFVNHKGGESIIEQHQRNFLSEGIKKADENDLIILSDSDEMPDLNKLPQIDDGRNLWHFSQNIFVSSIYKI